MHQDPSHAWKTFVPPISPPSNLCTGWINIGEAYLHVPLSIFRKFAPGAMAPFKDPTKRRFLKSNPNTLLRHMPIEFQKDLFFGRINLNCLSECLEKLAFMGLVSFEAIPKSTHDQAKSCQGDIFHDYGPGLAKGSDFEWIETDFSYMMLMLCSVS